jgi:hypothetical protein
MGVHGLKGICFWTRPLLNVEQKATLVIVPSSKSEAVATDTPEVTEALNIRHRHNAALTT